MRTDGQVTSMNFTDAKPRPNVVFVPGFLSRDEADTLLETIRAKAAFQQNTINIFGRKPIPRLEDWYGTWAYPYSNGVALPAKPMPRYLQDVIDRIEAARFGGFNAVLINKYRDGKDYISPHSDDDYGVAEPTIPSLTLGASRPFRLARIVGGTKPVKLDKSTTVEFLPGHGDLLVMRGRTNADWQHWIPKTAKPVGERINLTFRKKSVPGQGTELCGEVCHEPPIVHIESSSREVSPT